jgi:hypothetical protein
MPTTTQVTTDVTNILAPSGPEAEPGGATPLDTGAGKDVTRIISAFPPWGHCGPGERPFGLPPGPVTGKALASRAALLTSLLPQLTAMLKELGKAHLAGTLTPGDLGVLQSLQDWYSRLQAELDALKLRR